MATGGISLRAPNKRGRRLSAIASAKATSNTAVEELITNYLEERVEIVHALLVDLALLLL
jgi:hypothetical protein